MTVAPTKDQLQAFAQSGPEGPVHMLNLLRFHTQADYPEEAEFSPCSGAEAYARYGESILEILKLIGGSVELLSQCHASLIGDEQDHFDHMVVVHYPSRHALLQMLASEAYKQIAVHRIAAVEHSLLIPMTQFDTPLGSQQ